MSVVSSVGECDYRLFSVGGRYSSVGNHRIVSNILLVMCVFFNGSHFPQSVVVCSSLFL